ncbi:MULTISPECIES: sensor domain-containing protein [Clostridium]|uniref:Nitrogen fixation positive activator, putative n=1 Tax=Clostridium novyi (strain NT) TaxID=386415 RepID=A0PXI0_CLONN|nr:MULTISPECIES: EAL domain-containing protein [Clostridium]ABK61495.1 nitrogen fixation positive activator, putative [Clostridium novyi NT]KEH86239.1 nitrogen fixation protein [Clostridium novyi A str. BKT29909]KEH87183.1 nitrogen fixation protein [Clostridium novyi A str. NCTC 538]KEH89880.1 nitrogen fixation protein [Clostridium novyi A str. 4540]KEH93809.1 nitrogen fixation protein [Clostridium novyi A str. GD211209]
MRKDNQQVNNSDNKSILQNSHDVSSSYKRNDCPLEYSIFSEIIDSSKEGIMILDESLTVLYANYTLLKICERNVEEVINERIYNINKIKVEFYKNIVMNIKQNKIWTGELEYRSKSGRMYSLSILGKSIISQRDLQTYYIVIFEDVTKLKESERDINYLKKYDILTQLPQKELFVKNLKDEIIRLEGTGKLVGVVTLGLDDFKFINEAMGHLSGDRLLRDVTRRLKTLDKKCFLARITGDEFGIILTECEDIKDIENRINHIQQLFCKAFVINDQEVFVTASIGISIYPLDALNANELIMNATSAQNFVKKNGKNDYKIYSKDISKNAYKRIEMIALLKHAVENNQFVLHYQPQVSLESGSVMGVEALIRWNHPKLGLVYPDKFIPLAEKTGLIIPMGEWVIREACRQNKIWHDSGFEELVVSVNLSALQFEKEDLVDVIVDALKTSGLDPKFLEVEITEGILMVNTDKAIQTLNDLKEIGVKIAIDDFGTGYSSLSYLKEFPIDRLKIDRSFIMGIPKEDNGAIANIIIELAKSLHLNVVAEGTETLDHIKFLKVRKCDTIQGYYFSKPVSGEGFTEILRDNKKLYSNSI